MLETFNWPGNVRQLENTIFRAVVLCDGATLDVCDFPQIAAALGVETVQRQNPPLPATTPIVEYAAPAAPVVSPYALSVTDATGHVRKFEELEREIIRLSIVRYAEHMSEVARRLGIGRSTLYRKLKEYGLEPKSEQPPAATDEDGVRKAG